MKSFRTETTEDTEKPPLWGAATEWTEHSEKTLGRNGAERVFTPAIK